MAVGAILRIEEVYGNPRICWAFSPGRQKKKEQKKMATQFLIIYLSCKLIV